MVWMSAEMKLWDDLTNWRRQKANDKLAIQYGELSKIMRAEDYGMKEWLPSIEPVTGIVKREPYMDAVIIALRWVSQGNGIDHLCPFVSVMSVSDDLRPKVEEYAHAVLEALPMLYDKRETPHILSK